MSAWKLQPSARYLQVPSVHALYLPGVLLPDFLESLISCSLHLCFEIHTLYVQSAIVPLREARVTVPQLQVPEAAPFREQARPSAPLAQPEHTVREARVGGNPIFS